MLVHSLFTLLLLILENKPYQKIKQQEAFREPKVFIFKSLIMNYNKLKPRGMHMPMLDLEYQKNIVFSYETFY